MRIQHFRTENKWGYDPNLVSGIQHYGNVYGSGNLELPFASSPSCRPPFCYTCEILLTSWLLGLNIVLLDFTVGQVTTRPVWSGIVA